MLVKQVLIISKAEKTNNNAKVLNIRLNLLAAFLVSFLVFNKPINAYYRKIL